MKHIPQMNYTTYQLKLPVDIEKNIEISDPVYTFCEVFHHIDLSEYLVSKENETGRPRYDAYTLLKVILFAFMERGYVSTREIAKLCKTDIRFMWLLQDNPPPSHMTIDNFMNHVLRDSIEAIFVKINSYIFEKESVDLNHLYIDGSKIRANANMYSWVWKKSCLVNRDKIFAKISKLLPLMNERIIYYGVKFGTRTEYAIEYLEEVLKRFAELTYLEPEKVVRGRGHHKTADQRYYDELSSFVRRLKSYAKHVSICGEDRNSYSKTDHDATFMRVKRDYMGNDQLLPAYNLQFGVCDGYIAVYDAMRFASDMDCFQPLMGRFSRWYGFYPEYPVADAGYGSYNNYLYCEEHGMKKYMKFTMFQKETKDTKYREDPYRAVNFPIDEEGHPVCPGGKRFFYLKTTPVKGNQYGRTEEYYQCEDCTGCPHRAKCHKSQGNRVIRLNEELTSFHQEVLKNLNSVHGALLRMNRSIQSEGVFASIKWNRAYSRVRRRGLKGFLVEIGLVSIGFNLHKLHLRRATTLLAA